MKNKSPLVIAAICALVITGNAQAAEKKGGKEEMKGGKKRAEMIAKYDKDGDGKLNAEENAALRADKKKRMIEQFDEDKDGKLSPEENEKMQELIRKRHDSHKKPADKDKPGPAKKEAAGKD